MSEANISVIYGKTDIAPIVKSVEWFGHSDTPVRELNVTLKNTVDGRKLAVKFENGQSLVFSNNNEQLFVGVIFSTDVDEKGDMTVKAYDENIYLLKSTDTRKFSNVKASDIVKRLCGDFGIPVGSIADTGYVIPKLIFREKTLYEMILKALTLTQEQTGKRFFIANKNGKLQLVRFTDQPSKWMIEVGTNLLSAQYLQSIEETKTRVKVIGGKDGSIVVTQKNADIEKKFGVMQTVERLDEKATKALVEQRARELLKERSVIDDQAQITALGKNEIVTGTALYVREPMTGIIGGYFVESDSHTFANKVHTMSLELTATYEMPSLEIDKEELTDE